ncbi:MAG: methyltransferase domain-containing protein [Clostridiales Family XIII bacterium]|jgi:tRNA/tmRNA/rRNA uracil-C5-methylase (TrmA/RlmC/RlmD family)|nr:methyltransferase domain-containing protein [Clostridiales Family XIII bacterium]
MNLCPNAEVCGGCTYQGVPYAEQLEIKNAQVLESLQKYDIRIGQYVPMLPSPHIYGYRNKMEYTFGDEVKDGPMTLGMHRKRSYMSVINVDDCQIVTDDFNLIRKSTLDYMTEKGYTFLHKRSHEGLLRNLVIRRGEHTKELFINIVTSSQGGFDANEYKDFLLSLDTDENIVGIVHSIFDGKADKVDADEMHILYGQDYYSDELLGLKFKVNALAFFQTNTSAVELMFQDAIQILREETLGNLSYNPNDVTTDAATFAGGSADNKKLIFDVYCGTGTIGLSLAGAAREVVGIEIVEDSVKAATSNAEINGITNARFICGDALEVLQSLDEKPEVLIVDPPRMGMHPKALKKIISYDLDEILYISCNPKTWAENMATLQEYGYKADIVRAYDNFPFTKHIELVTLITKIGK